MSNRTIVLELDEDDYGTVQKHIAEYQARVRWKDKQGGVMLPEGDSNLPGAIIAELLRDLEEYESLWEAEHRPEE